MAGVNKVIIVGNLGNDPEMRTMPNGEAVANISVATSESWTDKNSGERREVTEWHRIVFFRRQAEVAGQYLRKGSKVYVEGRLKTRKWQDQNGQDRYTTEIMGDVLQMLDSRQGGGEFANNPAPMAATSGYNSPTSSRSNGYNAPASTGNEYDQTYSASAPASKPQYNSRPAAAAQPPVEGFDDDIPF